MEAIDPWPRFRITYEHAYGSSYEDFDTFRERDKNKFEIAVGALFDAVEKHSPWTVRRGWFDHPTVEWERVADLPGPEPTLPSAGAYRTAPSRVEDERVVARRKPPDALEAMLVWLATRPEMPWREIVREIVVTEEHIYTGRRDGTCWRVPLSTLRLITPTIDDPTAVAERDRVAWFGRAARLVLPGRPRCPVVRELERVLATRSSPREEADAP